MEAKVMPARVHLPQVVRAVATLPTGALSRRNERRNTQLPSQADVGPSRHQ